MSRRTSAAGLLVGLVLASAALHAEQWPARSPTDSRIRLASWREEEVYELRGRVGYQIDVEFEPGETFVGLAAGDIDALSFVAQANHLFLKPRAAVVRTNITVLTTRRRYHFHYLVSAEADGEAVTDAMFALRFTYPAKEGGGNAAATGPRIDAALRDAAADRATNIDYWYCGSPEIKPTGASDDGLHTRLQFAPRGELPALFVRNDDGSESLLNFSMDGGEVIIHRIARTFVVRRGRLTGCIVNKGFHGVGERAASGTVAPEVERVTEGGRP